MKKYEAPAMKSLAPAEKATKGLVIGDKLDTSFDFRLGKPIGFTDEGKANSSDR